jgi:hypothetical protein
VHLADCHYSDTTPETPTARTSRVARLPVRPTQHLQVQTMSLDGRSVHYPVLTNTEKAYLALRAGPLTSEQLRERLGGDINVMNLIIKRGHAVRRGHANQECIYALTPEGRAACPSRRDVERAKY